jgi:hypothetical protein
MSGTAFTDGESASHWVVVFGPVESLMDAAEPDRWRFVLLELGGRVPAGGRDAWTRIRFDERASVPFHVADAEGNPVGKGRIRLDAVMASAQLAERFLAAIERVAAGAGDLRGSGPLLLAELARRTGNEARPGRVFVQIGAGDGWAEFAELPRSGEGREQGGWWVREALRQCLANPEVLANELPWRPAGLPEIELKIDLAATLSRLWPLACECGRAVAAGEMPGFELFRGWPPIERRVFAFKMFGVDSPADAAGYLSFFRDAAGGWHIKRKWFSSDRAVRRETFLGTLSVDEPSLSHAREVAGGSAELTELPSAVRQRLKLKVVSRRTGRIFNLVLDHVRPTAGLGGELVQAEIEYSATLGWQHAGEPPVLEEAERIASWLESRLERVSIPHRRTHRSKLSFLRDLSSGTTQ